MRSSATKVTIAAALAAALVVVAPLSASAHVRVSPGEVAAGATNVQLSFSVPTEPADAPNGETTVLLRIDLPKDHPFESVYVEPVAGWTGKTESSPLTKPVTVSGKTLSEAVTSVVWTAQAGAGIPAGSFQNFAISVTPIPDVGRLTMLATQQFSNGAVERWADPLPHGKGTMPDHPAPTLFINETPPTLSGGMAGMSGMSMGSGTTTATSADSTSSSSGLSLPMWVAIAAAAMGAAGLVLGALAFARTRRRSTGVPASSD